MIRAAPLLFVCVCVVPCSAQVALESEAQAEEQSESESGYNNDDLHVSQALNTQCTCQRITQQHAVVVDSSLRYL